MSEVQFDRDHRRLDIKLDFPPGSRFAHPVTQQPSPVYDTAEQSWRHLNFFQFECYVHAFVPRVDGGPHGGVRQIEVPWARAHSGFTLFMESLMVLCAQTGMVQAVSKALDQVRRRECKTFPELLTGTRWLWLKGEEKLTEAEPQVQRSLLRRGKLHTGPLLIHCRRIFWIRRQRLKQGLSGRNSSAFKN